MATMNISLPEPLKKWVEIQGRSGRFSNSSDYVRDLIRRDQEREASIIALQEMITEGIESGAEKGFSMDAVQRKLDEGDG